MKVLGTNLKIWNYKAVEGYGILSALLYFSFLLYGYVFLPKIINSLDLMFEGVFQILYLFTLLLLTYFYIKLFRISDFDEAFFRSTLEYFIIFNIISFLIRPFATVDFFTYIYQARIFYKFGYSPYIYSYSQFFYDKLFSNFNNLHINSTAIYGPLFILITSIVGFLAQDSYFLNVYLFKALIVVLNLICAYMVFKITKSKKAFFLYSWNPLILFEVVINGHNEIFVIFFVLLGILIAIRYKSLLGSLFSWCFFVLSIFIKYNSAVILPFIFMFLLYRIKPKLKKLLFVILSLTLSFSIFLFFAVFAFPQGKMFEVLNYVLKLDMPRSSLFIVLVGNLFNFAGVWDFMKYARAFSRIVFFTAYFSIFSYWLNKRRFGLKSVIKFSSITVFLFLSIFVNIFWPWYLILLIVLLILYFGFNDTLPVQKDGVSLRKMTYKQSLALLPHCQSSIHSHPEGWGFLERYYKSDKVVLSIFSVTLFGIIQYLL